MLCASSSRSRPVRKKESRRRLRTMMSSGALSKPRANCQPSVPYCQGALFVLMVDPDDRNLFSAGLLGQRVEAFDQRLGFKCGVLAFRTNHVEHR